MHAYKLLNPDLTTHKRCQWEIGKWKETSGDGSLCGPGWLHAYPSPTMAHFLNPIHANIENPVLYVVEVEGDHLADHGLKVGYTRMRLLAQMTLPTPTTEQRVRFAIGCATMCYRAPTFLRWADAWLRGEDRTTAAAEAARAAAWAAAAWAAAEAAARAAEAAEAWSAEAWSAVAWSALAAVAAAETAAWSAAEAAAAAAEAAGSLDLEAMAVWAMSDRVMLPIQKGA